MKVKDIATPYDNPSASGWSGEFDEIIKKLGFTIVSRHKGKRDNRTDGEYHEIFAVELEGIKYAIDVNSNWYYNEEEKLNGVMNSPLLS